MQPTDDRGLSNVPRDTQAIHRLIGRARRRIRGQWALEGATTAAILAAAAALAAIFAIRVELIPRSTGLALLIVAAGIVALGAIISAVRRIDDERVARRIDRASHLSDRLSTAVAFSRSAHGADGDLTHDLMLAAIRDGVRAVPRADVKRATPFAAPADLRAAVGFLVISALAAGLAIPTVDRTPRLYRAEPDHGAPGDEVLLRGAHLLTGVAHAIASLPVPSAMAAPGVPPEAIEPSPAMHGFVPLNAQVTLGDGRAHPARVLDWSANVITIRIPDDTPIGPTTLTVWIGDDPVGPIAFTVIDKKDPRYHRADSVVLDPDDRAYFDSLLAQIRAAAKRDGVPELEDFVKQIEQMLQDAELGKISKEKLLDALLKADAKLKEKAEPDQADVDKQLAELGKQLSKDQLTKDLGDALQKTELDKAQKELEKLAEKLENNQLSDKDKEQLAKQLEKASKQLEDKQQQQQQQQQQKQAQQQKKLEDEIRRLEKKKQQAKTEQEQLEAERQLDKKKDELKKLEKDAEGKEQSTQREALKRLARDLEKASQDLKKPSQSQQQDQDKQQDQGQQASQKLKDAARETGRVDQDRRKQATQKKMASQMEELREAMQRAKQKGQKGGQDPFGKNGKSQDFAQRARGQRGQSSAWKPGQGQQGQGQQGQGQQGQGQQNGKEWGVGHDDNLAGDPTQKSGNTKDDELQGKQGSQGGGTRETILAAAQKGFATQRYRDVYGKYHQIVEEVMRTEKLPSSYKYYVKRYFAKIHPSGADDTLKPENK